MNICIEKKGSQDLFQGTYQMEYLAMKYYEIFSGRTGRIPRVFSRATFDSTSRRGGGGGEGESEGEGEGSPRARDTLSLAD